MQLKGKVAIVTGAGSGFGEGIARRFCEAGAKLVLNDLNADSVARVAASIRQAGGPVEVVVGDVAHKNTWIALTRRAAEAFGRLDTVVNNAGWCYKIGPLLDLSDDDFDRVFAINVKSIFLSAKYAVPMLRKAGGGSFVQIGSTVTRRPIPGLGPYGGTKSALITMSASMAAEFGPDKIRVNVINPAFAVTGLVENFTGGGDTPEMRARFTAAIPLGRLTTPQDIANAAVFLASDEAEFITGAVLQVDGGRAI